jgi:hypothetical protein
LDERNPVTVLDDRKRPSPEPGPMQRPQQTNSRAVRNRTLEREEMSTCDDGRHVSSLFCVA